MDAVTTRVEAAGRQVVVPRIATGENGFMAMIIYTEGNSIGVHLTE